MQSDETALINDFRMVLSKLNSLEKLDLVRGALKALETENEKYSEANKQEKSDFDEKFKRPSTVTHESVPLKPNFSVNSENHVRHDGFIEASSNREMELYKKIEELQEENKRLFTSVEELDQQHEESIGNDINHSQLYLKEIFLNFNTYIALFQRSNDFFKFYF